MFFPPIEDTLKAWSLYQGWIWAIMATMLCLMINVYKNYSIITHSY